MHIKCESMCSKSTSSKICTASGNERNEERAKAEKSLFASLHIKVNIDEGDSTTILFLLLCCALALFLLIFFVRIFLVYFCIDCCCLNWRFCHRCLPRWIRRFCSCHLFGYRARGNKNQQQRTILYSIVSQRLLHFQWSRALCVWEVCVYVRAGEFFAFYPCIRRPALAVR